MFQKSKRLFFLFSLLSLLLSFPLYAENTYTITESEKKELEKILEDYERIQKNLEAQKNGYEEITKSLETGLNDLRNQNRKTLIKNCIIVGSITFSVGLTVGVIATSVICNNMRN